MYDPAVVVMGEGVLVGEIEQVFGQQMPSALANLRQSQGCLVPTHNRLAKLSPWVCMLEEACEIVGKPKQRLRLLCLASRVENGRMRPMRSRTVVIKGH